MRSLLFITLLFTGTQAFSQSRKAETRASYFRMVSSFPNIYPERQPMAELDAKDPAGVTIYNEKIQRRDLMEKESSRSKKSSARKISKPLIA